VLSTTGLVAVQPNELRPHRYSALAQRFSNKLLGRSGSRSAVSVLLPGRPRRAFPRVGMTRVWRARRGEVVHRGRVSTRRGGNDTACSALSSPRAMEGLNLPQPARWHSRLRASVLSHVAGRRRRSTWAIHQRADLTSTTGYRRGWWECGRARTTNLSMARTSQGRELITRSARRRHPRRAIGRRSHDSDQVSLR
jgi:hypothetical protein